MLAAGQSPADPLLDLGRRLFFDTNLSVNGAQSCASCHDPASGFAASGHADSQGVVPGALGGSGTRKPPTAAYALAPVLHHVIDEGQPLFIGGLFHDGRATGAATGNPLSDQVSGPLLSPF